MTKLRHLVAEVDAALDIYLAGRTGQQFNKVAFILADDCCELASKLFLITQNPAWDDDKRPDKAVGKPRWKNFKEVTAEVRAACPAAADVLTRIEARRDRRNGFFHSAHLLDLTLQPRDVKDALSDLLDYGTLLFGAEWEEEVKGQGNLETAAVIIRLDCKAHADPSIGPKSSQHLCQTKAHRSAEGEGLRGNAPSRRSPLALGGSEWRKGIEGHLASIARLIPSRLRGDDKWRTRRSGASTCAARMGWLPLSKTMSPSAGARWVTCRLQGGL